jgi:hypothetical protein
MPTMLPIANAIIKRFMSSSATINEISSATSRVRGRVTER